MTKKALKQTKKLLKRKGDEVDDRNVNTIQLSLLF